MTDGVADEEVAIFAAGELASGSELRLAIKLETVRE